MNRNPRIVYMGTPEFAVAPLNALIEAGYTVAGVVTAPDKPAGRGLKLKASPVKQFALQNNITVLQPDRLKAPEFLQQLRELNADLFVVVAFRMLPKEVWAMPPMGTFNLHASLLPQYRGAAPINWAIINGETVTGVTTFFIDEQIDTGAVLLRKEVPIAQTDTAGTLHDKLMEAGAPLVVETVRLLARGKLTPTPQQQHHNTALKSAPKLFKDTCKICWNKPSETVYNHIRGLSPYPAAWCTLKFESKSGIQTTPVKLYSVLHEIKEPDENAGKISTDHKTYLKVACSDGYIEITELQQAGKKRLHVKEFLRGWQNATLLEML